MDSKLVLEMHSMRTGGARPDDVPAPSEDAFHSGSARVLELWCCIATVDIETLNAFFVSSYSCKELTQR